MGIRSISGILTVLILIAGACSSSDKKQEEQITDRMSEEHRGDEPEAAAAQGAEPGMPLDTGQVTYATVNGASIKGYLARPDTMAAEKSGVIVIHEWWGLNDNIRKMTRRLAGQGYVALAVDLYRGRSASNPDSARKLMQAAMNRRGAATDNLKQAYQYLAGEAGASKVGVIGWCFGGGWSLNTALALPDKIDATVIYYGQLVTDPDRLQALSMPILGNFGAEDGAIPPGKVRRFETVLDSLGKSADIKIYEGAGHAFANPSGNRYQPEAAKDAWMRTLGFFRQHLR